VVHPGWAWGVPDSQGRVDDIALMRLDKPILTLRPATIREASHRTSVRVMGWGYTTQPTDPDRTAPVQMQQLDVPLEDPSHCGGNGFIGNSEICLGLGVNGGGAFYGDSGTAAAQTVGHSLALVGSASRLPELSCGVKGQDYAVYTDVAKFVPWMIRVALGLPADASVAGKPKAHKRQAHKHNETWCRSAPPRAAGGDGFLTPAAGLPPPAHNTAGDG
jgi:secreted trypsin-like serine protease